MIRAAAFNVFCAFMAYQQANLCAGTASRLGYWAAAILLLHCFLANRIFAAWWRGH